MKKVLFICSLYHPHVGGIETMVTELSKFYRKQGIECVVLTKRWPTTLTEEDEYKNVKIYRVISAKTKDDFLNVDNWIKNNEEKIKADIIHIIGVRRPLPVFGLSFSKSWNVPLISTIAGSEIPNTGDPETDAVWNESKNLMKPVIESSDLVTCVSKALEKDLRKVVPNTKSVRTVYAGIDTEFINSVICKEIEKNYIVSLRRLIPSKGIDILIKAFKDIAKEYPQIKLIIAGKGQEEENLKSLVKNLNLEDKVKFIGTVSMERCVSLLKGALCTVVPSLSEGGSLVNVEAQAASCPVVASRVGGIPEYVQDEISGLLFEAGNSKDLAEKIRKILSDIPLRNKLIQGGTEHAKKFSWNVLGPQYLALYDEMTNIKHMETINKILNQYDVFERVPIELIRESSDNFVYLIGNTNKKILRISKRLPIEDVQFEYEVSQHLAKNNFPVARWIKTKGGNFYAYTEEIEIAVIFQFLEGYHAQVDKNNLPTKEQAYTAGQALASMHEIGKTFKPSTPRSRNAFIELERVLRNEGIFKKDFEGGETFVEQVKKAIEFGKENKSPTGLIHNDYRSGNIFFKNDKEVSGVIDFDWSCIGPIMKDIALGVLEWSFPDGRTEPDFPVFDAFLNGYNSVSKQKYTKGKELYLWIMFTALSDISTFFCDRLSSPQLKKRITSSYMYMKYLYFSKL